MPKIRSTDGVRLNYLESGDPKGRPVLLVAGFKAPAASWKPQLAALEGAGYRVIAFDRRGHGASEVGPDDHHTMDRHGADIHDLLLLPTTVIKATPIPPPGASPQEITRRSWEGTRNTCPFNVTGHPAISIPCGMEDGRPIGMMLVGQHWDERTIYRASAAFERSGDWMKF